MKLKAGLAAKDADQVEVALAPWFRQEPMSLLLSAAVDSDYEWIRFHLIGQPSADEWAAIYRPRIHVVVPSGFGARIAELDQIGRSDTVND